MRRRKFSRRHEQGLDETLINLTPLIDVVFVVLIAFILIAPLLDVDHVDLAGATESTEKDLSQKGAIKIYVREDDSIWINNRLVTDTELISVLKEAKEKFGREPPQVYHDKKACFGTYQKVKGAAEKAGFETIDIILKSN